jgi:hypothetical protein
MPTERICMSMILLEPANKITYLSLKDQAADHLINSEVPLFTLMIWKKWADDEQVKMHEESVGRAPFRPRHDHPLCALGPVLQAQLS